MRGTIGSTELHIARYILFYSISSTIPLSSLTDSIYLLISFSVSSKYQTDIVNGIASKRDRRVAITFRKVVPTTSTNKLSWNQKTFIRSFIHSSPFLTNLRIFALRENISILRRRTPASPFPLSRTLTSDTPLSSLPSFFSSPLYHRCLWIWNNYRYTMRL